MSFRHCIKCGSGQDQITIDDIADAYSGRIECECGEPRCDDTTEERTRLIAEALVELREELRALRTGKA